MTYFSDKCTTDNRYMLEYRIVSIFTTSGSDILGIRMYLAQMIYIKSPKRCVISGYSSNYCTF